MAETTLYARLGGYDVIAAVVDEFLQTLCGIRRWRVSRPA